MEAKLSADRERAIKAVAIVHNETSTGVTMHFDYSDSQISFADSFYADPDYPIDSYLSR